MKGEMEEWLKSNDSKEYFELMRFQSVGSDPIHLRDCTACATWLKKWLKSIGAEAEIVVAEDAMGVPVVVGERRVDEGALTVLVYGHYDVQPADPLDEWQTPPFEPTVKDGRIYCRGAQDDKGQLFAFLCGVREYLDGKPKVNFKFVFDGQEESGSGTLFKLLESSSFRRRIAADMLVVCDTSAAPDLRPAIIAGLRGVSHFTVRLTGANRDLHSGEYGGIAPNAAQAMVELLSTLHTRDGAVAVAGFRDGIEPPTHEEMRLCEASTPSEDDIYADIGTGAFGGQIGKTIAQRLSFEPTIEINGIHSGFGGVGAKTVIPNEAIAKISMRLVPGQSPRQVFECVRKHLEDNLPKGMKLSIEEADSGSAGFRLPIASPVFRLAEDVLGEMDKRGALFMWDGASIPVVSALREATSAAPLIVGWGQPADRIHSPNESYSPEQFAKAREWAVRILSAL